MKRRTRLPKPAYRTRRGISLPMDVLVRGIERARHDNRNFSAYVTHLIARDVKAAAEEATRPA